MRPSLAVLLIGLWQSGCGLSPRSVFGIAKVKDQYQAASALRLPAIDPSINMLETIPVLDTSPGTTSTPFKDKRQATDATLKPCAFAGPGPEAQTNFVPTLDGDLGDWPSQSLMAFDRSGDGLSQDPGQDLTALYVAEGKNEIYVGIKLAASWSGTSENESKLFLDFTSIKPEVSASPNFALRTRFLLRDGDNLYNDAEYPNAVDAEKFLAVSGSGGVEFKITRSGGLIELGDIYAIHAYVAKSASDTQREQIGAYIGGLFADYVCMKQFPHGGTKALVMRRYPGVPAHAAEELYRGVLAGAVEVEGLLGDGLDAMDTIPVNVLNLGQDLGHADASLGLYFAKGLSSGASGMLGAGARLYALLLARADYRMLTDWMVGGFAEWASLRALRQSLGPALWKRQFDAAQASVVKHEDGGIVHLASMSGLEQNLLRKKAALLFELWAANAETSTLLGVYDRRLAPGNSIDSEDAFLDQISIALGVGSAGQGSNIWRGWVKFGEYNAAPASPASFANYFGR